MIADDLFAGAGGWDLAAAKLGIHARGVENMKEARATREAAGLATIHDDVWTFRPDGDAEGLIASPPCQTFSAAGKGAGRKALEDVLRGIRDNYVRDIEHLHFLGEEVGDSRTALVLTPLHFALDGNASYDWLAWEQVPTVLPVWEACAEVLRDSGWNVWTGLLQAEMFGVPQTRKRAFLLASRVAGVQPPAPTHSRYYPRDPERLDEGALPWVSFAQAMGWALPDDRSAWLTSPSGITGAAVRHANHPAHTVTGADNYYAFGVGEWVRRNPGRELPDWVFNRPSTTIVGSFKPEIVAAPGYRTTVSRQNAPGSVRVTVAEAGVLQSFPADYPWQGARGKQFLQCGNAVPPLLATHALATAAGVHIKEIAA